MELMTPQSHIPPWLGCTTAFGISLIKEQSVPERSSDALMLRVSSFHNHPAGGGFFLERLNSPLALEEFLGLPGSRATDLSCLAGGKSNY